MTETITVAEYRALGKKPKGESESAATRRLFLFQISARKLPTPRAKGLPGGEVKFMGDQVVARHTKARKLVHRDRAPGWAFDFAWERERIAVEVEGLVVYKGADGRMQTRGRHTTPEGFNEDCEKYAWAAVMGWTVVRFTPLQVKRGFAIDMLVRLFASREAQQPLVVSLEDIRRESLLDLAGQPHRVTDELSFGNSKPADSDPF